MSYGFQNRKIRGDENRNGWGMEEAFVRNGYSEAQEDRIIREEDNRMGAVFELVQDYGYRAAGISADLDLRIVRALRREVTVTPCHASSETRQRSGPLQPEQLPPAIARPEECRQS